MREKEFEKREKEKEEKVEREEKEEVLRKRGGKKNVAEGSDGEVKRSAAGVTKRKIYR